MKRDSRSELQVPLSPIGEAASHSPSSGLGTHRPIQDNDSKPHMLRPDSRYIPRVPSIASLNILLESRVKNWRIVQKVSSLSDWASPPSKHTLDEKQDGETEVSSSPFGLRERLQYLMTSVILLFSSSAGRDKCSGFFQHAFQFMALMLAKYSYEDPIARIRLLMMQGFAGSLSNARKVLRMGRSLDEVEKIKFILYRMGGNPIMRTASAVAHGFSFMYYLLDNYIYVMKVQLASMQKMGQGTKYDPHVEDAIRVIADTKMAGVYNYTKAFTEKLKYFMRIRNMCSLSRLVIAIVVEGCRLYELGIEVQRADADPYTAPEAREKLRKKKKISILKLVQDSASFMKLCAAFGGDFWLLPNVSETEAAFFGMINCALGIRRNWPSAKVVSNQSSYFAVPKTRSEPKKETMLREQSNAIATKVIYAEEEATYN